MSKSNTFENDFLKLIFQGTPIANLADNAASAPATSLYLSLHSADPDEGGTQATNEIAYTGYARAAVARNSGGFDVTNNIASLVAAASFPACTGGTATATHFGVGLSAHPTAGKLLFSGPVSPSLSISSGVTPSLSTSTTITED